MALTFFSLPPFLVPKPHFLSLKPQYHVFTSKSFSSFISHPIRSLRPPAAFGKDGKFYPNPADDEPPEAPEDSEHGVSRLEQIERLAARARKREEEDFIKHQSTILAAIENEEDAPDNPDDLDDSEGDLFGEIDKAIAMKRKEFVKQGLLKPNPKKVDASTEDEPLEPEESADLDEIKKLQELKDASEGSEEEKFGASDDEVNYDTSKDRSSSDPSFDFEFDIFGKARVRIKEPEFRMTLAELLDESKVVPVSVYGNIDVEISGIQHDSRLITAGDLFVCCVGLKTDGHLFLTEADKRGAVAVVASKELGIEETLGCKALVIVEDTNAVLSALAASFYRHPSRSLALFGITGTNGKTTTAYLVKGMYEAMGQRTGMVSTVDYYLHGNNKLEMPNKTPDAVMVQNLMAKMLNNGTEALVLETSAQELVLGRSDEIDFDVAIFTNLTRDHSDFNGTEEEYRDAMAKLFSRMVDPERHRKIVNIDDPNAPFFIDQGSPDVPVVTFAMNNKNADVHPLKFELSLFETLVLVNTPNGILEISSGLIGKHNIYNILAAVAVGIAVGAPLEDIVRGIEEVDAVPGRCELIDEEQTYGVIVDCAKTPDAFSRLLDSVKELGPKRIITVIGCPGETERGKRPVMAQIATEKSDVTILTSDNPKNEDPLDILDDMLAGVGMTMQDYLKQGEDDYYPPLPNGHRLFLHDVRGIAVRSAVAMGEEGDVVVIAGKGHETFEIEGDQSEFFDDRDECREALQSVDELHVCGIDTSEFPWRFPESH